MGCCNEKPLVNMCGVERMRAGDGGTGPGCLLILGQISQVG